MNFGSGILRGRRILVVEDEAMVSMMIVDLLTQSGAMVIGPAGTTREALAFLGEEELHCAILDVKLADGMSVLVAEALAALGVPFVVATGYSGEVPHEYNGAPVLRKVFTNEQLIEAIADILRP